LLILISIALALALFGRAFGRLRGRGRLDHAGLDRVGLFLAAVGIASAALISPLDEVAETELLSAHMLQHVLIGDLVPVLLLLAVRGPLLFFLLPPAALRILRRLAWLGVLLRPSVAFLVWAGSLAIWHVPAIYDAALRHQVLHDAEHVSFAVGGILVWAQLIDPARRRSLTSGGKLAYALLLFVAAQALANVLVLSYRPLYPTYAALTDRPFGLSAIGDQDTAGLVMMAEQFATLGTFALLTLRMRFRQAVAVIGERHPFAA
jgi:cytochrome c oxidase assembly factor CtaG